MKSKIHFTPSFATLQGIVASQSLRISYCREAFCMGDKIVSNAVHPMVCFSEYELGTIHNMTLTYGQFGIALSDDWADQNNLHPVLYIRQKSVIATALANLLKARRNVAKDDSRKEFRLPIMSIKCFTKNDVGYNSYFNEKGFVFKNENEWRYVPEKKSIGGYFISLNRSSYEKRPRYYNNRIKNYALKFKISDLQAVFVSTESERQTLLNSHPLLADKVQLSLWKTRKRGH
jgi:hypothetical protein